MALFNVFVVCLAVLQVAFSSVPAIANKGFSFSLKTDPGYKNPPDLTFIAQISNDAKAEAGRAFNAYLGTGEAGVDAASTPRASAKVTAPQFVWSDSNGNVYFTDSHNHVIRKVAKNANEDVTIYAGAIATSGFADNADPTVARFNRPRGISGDSTRIIVADTGNFRLRRIDLNTGAVTTFAGSATQGYSGDLGAATSAELWSPYGVWVNGKNGDVYFTELHKCAIRKVAASTGNIETIVGTFGVCGYNGDGNGITPTTVLLDLPRAIYGDASGNVYWTEFNNNVVRYLSSLDNFVYTAAGGKLNSPNALTDLGDGGDATNAALNQPTGIWVDRVGNLYITESYTAVVRRVNADDKKISTFAGTLGARGPAGENAGKNVLFHPRGIYGDQFLNFKIYLPDSDNHRIVTVSLPHPTISTFAGSSPAWDGIAANGDGGDATSAKLTAPADVWKDTNGNLFFTDYERGNVRKVDSAGIITTFVGGANNDGNAVSAPTSVAGTSATFDKPWGIWGDNTYLYVSDSANKVVRRIAWSDKLVTIFAGGGAGTTFGVAATSVALGTPSGLWGSKADNTGLVYFADVEDCIIRSVTKPGGILNKVVGVKGTCTFSTTFNSGTWTLGYPRGLGGDKNGNLYVAEYNSADGSGSVIRKWQLTGVAAPNQYQIVVGASDGAPAYTNAPNTYAIVGTKVDRPNSIWFDANDNMYFTEVGASAVRVVYSDSYLLVTLSGGNGNGFAGDGSVPYDPAVQFDKPFGLWGDSNSNLFVADQLNSRVRKITELNGAPARRLLSNTTAAVEETPKFNLRRA